MRSRLGRRFEGAGGSLVGGGDQRADHLPGRGRVQPAHRIEQPLDHQTVRECDEDRRDRVAAWLLGADQCPEPGDDPGAELVDHLVNTVIEHRIANPHDTPTDLLDLLIASGEDEVPLTAREVRDEVSTLVLAGHETTANTLAWTFTLLSRFPAARERLHAEVDEVLAGREPQAADVDQLSWTNAVIQEAMRLYPPVWTIERDAVEADVTTGVDVPAGTTVVISRTCCTATRSSGRTRKDSTPVGSFRAARATGPSTLTCPSAVGGGSASVRASPSSRPRCYSPPWPAATGSISSPVPRCARVPA